VTINITPVNDAPIASGAASLASISEDSTTPAGDTVSNLFSARFNDSADQVTGGTSSNSLAGIAITNYTRASSKGEWQYSTDGGTSWTSISASISPTELGDTATLTIASTHRLRFLPKTDFNGPAPSLSVRLLETPMSVTTGATVDVSNNGGSTTISSSKVVLSQSVTALNDAPLANGSAILPSILEGNLNPIGTSVAVLFNLNFNDSADNVSGGSTANTLAGVAICSYAEDILKGRWQYSTDNGSTWLNLLTPQVPSLSDSTAMALKRTDLLRFKPANDDYYSTSTSPVPVLCARLIDSSFGTLTTGVLNVSTNGFTSPVSYGVVTLTTSVTSVNDAPISVDQTVTAYEDTAYTLSKGNFGFGTGFSDPKDTSPNNFVKVIITTLPVSGILRFSGASVSVGDSISIQDIEEGKLRYTPAANVAGTDGVNSFVAPKIGFKVRDDGGVANGGVDTSVSTYTVTINITPVNDPPTSGGFGVSTDEDFDYTFNDGVFPFADATDSPANTLQSVTITSLPAVGTLKLGSTPVTVGQVIPVASLGTLKFTPNANSSGNEYAFVGFKVQDNGGTDNGGVDTSLSTYTVTINVNAVNDQPLATGNATLAPAFKNTPNQSGVTVQSLFGSLYSDPNDQPNPNSLTGIAITDLTHDALKGTWQYQPAAGGDWTPLSSSISSSASLTLKTTDRLRFIPANDYVGAAPQMTIRLIENDPPTTGGSVNLSGALSPDSNYSSNTSTLNHEVKGGLLVKGLPDISEGSNAVFTVSFDTGLTSDTAVTLELSNVTTESDDYLADFNDGSSWDNTKVNVYYLSGSTPVLIPVTSGAVTINGLQTFYVSVPTVNNAVYEGPESLRLTASMSGSSSSDTSTILDNGYGVVYKNDGTPSSGYTSDNDLTVDVTAINTVNEGSDYAFFTVEGTSGDRLQLAVADGSATLVAPRIEYSLVSTTTVASDWVQYDGAGNIPLVPGVLGSGTGTVYVRVSIASEQDDTYEGAETFTLTAISVINGGKSDFDTATIIDNGTGKKFGPNITSGQPDQSESGLDDDRALEVTSYGPVNERKNDDGFMYSMFKVTGPVGAQLNLQTLNPVVKPATLGSSPISYSYNGSSWTTYTWNGTSGDRPTVQGTGILGEVYVRVDATSEWDDLATNGDNYERSETFRLQASTQAKSATGVGEILDDGSGNVFTGNWGTTTPSTITRRLDDDRVWAVFNQEKSNLQALVTVSARSNDGATSGVVISDEIDLDASTIAVDSQLVIPGQGTWAVVNGNITYQRLASYTQDPSRITYAIRPTDRPGNFSLNTAQVDIDFPVITQPDSNQLTNASGNPIEPGQTVSIPVLDNDLSGDLPIGSTLRFPDGTNTAKDQISNAQGTWTIAQNLTDSKWYVTFAPAIGFLGDPTPVNYTVMDADGNVSALTRVSVVYSRAQAFIVRINEAYETTSADVIIIDNMPAGRSVTVGTGANQMTIFSTHGDTNSTVGRIAWSGVVGRFSRAQIDARSKPVLMGSMADISITASATSSSAASIDFQAMDMGYSLTPGSKTLVSPLGGINYGTVSFTETVGLDNRPFPSTGEGVPSNTTPSGQISRTLNWTGSSNFNLPSSTSVSLMKSVRINHTAGTKTTQVNAGGKILDLKENQDLLPYTQWVMPSGSNQPGLSLGHGDTKLSLNPRDGRSPWLVGNPISNVEMLPDAAPMGHESTKTFSGFNDDDLVWSYMVGTDTRKTNSLRLSKNLFQNVV
jgi:hypothetical protein